MMEENKIYDFLQMIYEELQETKKELKAEIQEVKTELKAEIQDMRKELKTDIQELKTELQDMRKDINNIEIKVLKNDNKIIELYQKEFKKAE